MIKSYKYSRDALVRMFKFFGEKTKDGNWWIPDFSHYAYDDSGLEYDFDYLYRREIFYGKVFFTPREVSMLLAKKKDKHDFEKFEVDEMHRLNDDFLKTNSSILSLNLDDKVDNMRFTVEELLDCYIYLKDIKNNY